MDTPQILVITLIAAVLIIRIFGWQSKNFHYHCTRCGHKFKLSRAIDYLGPHGLGHKYLKCPQCGKWGWLPLERS